MKKENFVLDPSFVDEALQKIEDDTKVFKNSLDRFISILKAYVDVIFSFIVGVHSSTSNDEFMGFINKLLNASLIRRSKESPNILVPAWVTSLTGIETYHNYLNLFIELFVKNKDDEYFRNFGISIYDVSGVFEDGFYDEVGGREQEKTTDINTKKEVLKKLINKLDTLSYLSWYDVFKDLDVEVIDDKDNSNIGGAARKFGMVLKDTLNSIYLSNFIRNFKPDVSLEDSTPESDIFDFVCALDHLLNKYGEFFGYDKERLKNILRTEPFLYFVLVKVGGALFSSPTKNSKIKDYKVENFYRCYFEPDSELESIRIFRNLVLNSDLGFKNLELPPLNSPHLSTNLKFDVFGNEAAVKFYERNMNGYFKTEYPVLCMFFALLFHDDVEVVKKFYVFVSFVELVFVLIFLAELLFIRKVRLLGLDLDIETAIADDKDSLKRYIKRTDPDKRYIEDNELGRIDDILRFYEGSGVIRGTMLRLLLNVYQTFWSDVEKRDMKLDRLFSTVSTSSGERLLSFYENKHLTSYTNTNLYRFVLSISDKFFKKVVEYARHPVFLKAKIKILNDNDIRAINQNHRNIKNGSFNFLVSSSFSGNKVDFFKTWVCTVVDVSVSSFINNLSFTLSQTSDRNGAALFFKRFVSEMKKLYSYLWRALGKVGDRSNTYL